MDESILRFRVGVFVFFAFLILGLLIFLNSEGSLFTRKYTIYVKPASAPGVTRGTPVRKNGLLIGRVGSANTQDDHVVLSLDINQGENIYENEICSIGADSFLGDAVVEILPLPRDQRGEIVNDGNVMGRVSVKRNPLEVVDVALNLEEQITKTLDAVREGSTAMGDAGQGVLSLTELLQGSLTDDTSDIKSLLTDIQLVSKKAQAALDNFNRIFENLNSIVGDPDLKGEVKDVFTSLPEILDEIKTTISDTRETINGYRSVSEKASANLDNLEPFTASLKTEGTDIVAQVNSSMKNVDTLIEKVGTFAETLSKVSQELSESEGTVGKLLNDPALYNSALSTVQDVRTNINEISVRLEPLMNDLRMFADSLARDPRQLGVRGAIGKRKTGSGYKGSTVGRERIFR